MRFCSINTMTEGEEMILIALTSSIKNESRLDSVEIENCILQIAQGHKGYLESLYRQTSPSVYGFTLSIIKNPQDAEDILQNTYIKIFETASTYVPLGKPMAWILTIAKNLSLMKIREHQKFVDLEQEEWDKFHTQNENLSSDDKMVLNTAMRVLTDEERQIVMLHAVAGFKHREIAELLQLSLSTTLSKYHRAMKRLQIIIKEG